MGVTPRLIRWVSKRGVLSVFYEYAPGRDLYQWAQETARDDRIAFLPRLRVMMSGLLARLHKRGILMGDVNAGNFVLSPDNKRMWIIDFDTASSARADLECVDMIADNVLDDRLLAQVDRQRGSPHDGPRRAQ